MFVVSAGAVARQDAVVSRLERLVETAYRTAAAGAEQFFAGRDAGVSTTVREGRIVVYGDGSCRYRAVQPYGESTRTYRQVPLDADWTGYCEDVYAPLEAAAAASEELPRRVADAVIQLEPGTLEPDDVAPVRRWLAGQDAEPVAERCVYRG